LKKSLFVCMMFFAVSALFTSCNEEVSEDFSPELYVHYDIPSTAFKNDTCDLTKIKSIKIYNYCCSSGWANVPAKLTFYTTETNGVSNIYKSRKTDESISNLPFSDIVIDEYGYTLEWTLDDTGVYNGSPKTLSLRKIKNVESVARMISVYDLEITSGEFVNGGGIQISFVDKDGNESNQIYLQGSKGTDEYYSPE